MSDGARAYVALAREHLGLGRTLETHASGYSMWPWVRPGQAVRILPCRGAGAERGDVVLVARGAKLVLHRVVALRHDAVLLQGDALCWPDGWTPRSAVLGRLGRSPLDPLLGRASRWLAPGLYCLALVARKIDAARR